MPYTTTNFTFDKIGHGYGYGIENPYAPYYGTYFNGSLDEFYVFDKPISKNQISEIYQAGLTGIHLESISFEETSPGEVWDVVVTPNNSYEDEKTILSNVVNILDE